MRQVGSALDAAHRLGVLHLDVKPSNILFRGNPQKVDHIRSVLADFGIARPIGRAGSKELTLTVEYASPEQARLAQGEQAELDHRSDLYSLGVLVYEMLSGGPPFQGRSNQEVLHSIIHDNPPLPLKGQSELLNGILSRALSKNPEHRYQTARQLVEDLNALLPLEIKPRRVRRTSVVLSSPIAGAVLGLILGLILGIPLGSWMAKASLKPTPTAVLTPIHSRGATLVPTFTPTTVATLPATRATASAVPATVAPTSALANTPESVDTPKPTSTRRPTRTPTLTSRPSETPTPTETMVRTPVEVPSETSQP